LAGLRIEPPEEKFSRVSCHTASVYRKAEKKSIRKWNLLSFSYVQVPNDEGKKSSSEIVDDLEGE
jgi:hypothetical protein